jgi:DNA modification methylase
VAVKHGRAFVGVELNPDYWQMAKDRIEAEIARPKQLGLAI